MMSSTTGCDHNNTTTLLLLYDPKKTDPRSSHQRTLINMVWGGASHGLRETVCMWSGASISASLPPKKERISRVYGVVMFDCFYNALLPSLLDYLLYHTTRSSSVVPGSLCEKQSR